MVTVGNSITDFAGFVNRNSEKNQKKEKNNMCRFCRKIVCPPFCAAERGREEEPGGERCRNCGAPLSADEGIYRSHGKPYCRTCIENALPDDLVRFCEATWDEWLSGMGIETIAPTPRVHIGGNYDV